jgi:hypothetical protein
METGLPPELDNDIALRVPVLASVLELWERAGLELGEVAIVGGPHPLSALVAHAAVWSGAGRVMHVGRGALAPGIATIEASPADAAVARLTGFVAGAPGFAAVDLSGSSAVIELLVATLPRWGRLLLAGPSERFAVDFYNDVHRKGAVVAGAPLEPAAFVRSSHPAVGALRARHPPARARRYPPRRPRLEGRPARHGRPDGPPYNREP